MLVQLAYGVTFTVAHDVMPLYLHAFGFITLRVGVTAILFFIVHSIFIKEKINWRKDWLLMVVCSLFGVAANMLMFFKGLEITTPINGAVLMLTTPVFVVLLAAGINHERITIIKGAGILLAATGGLILIAGSDFNFSGKTLPGDILIILNATSYALYLVLVKRLLGKYNTLTVSKWTFLIGLVMVLPFGFRELISADFTTMPQDIIFKITFIVLCTTFLAYLLTAWAVIKIGSSTVGTYIYLQPLFTALI
ncbi:MAG: DMT family transporter, partial [Bacteroidia bacterium]|nr:DMT family transporter [Bacteroidia bacterium]